MQEANQLLSHIIFKITTFHCGFTHAVSVVYSNNSLTREFKIEAMGQLKVSLCYIT